MPAPSPARERAEQEERIRAEIEALQSAEEEQLRREAEAIRLQAEEEQQRLEADANRRADEQRQRLEEARRYAEEQRRQIEEEVSWRAEEEERRLAELEWVRKKAEEAASERAEREERIKAEIAVLQKAEEEELGRIEVETRRRVEAEARLKEEQARRQIDRMLGQCGWIVQDRDQMHIAAGPGVDVSSAIAVSDAVSLYMTSSTPRTRGSAAVVARSSSKARSTLALAGTVRRLSRQRSSVTGSELSNSPGLISACHSSGSHRMLHGTSGTARASMVA